MFINIFYEFILFKSKLLNVKRIYVLLELMEQRFMNNSERAVLCFTRVTYL